MAAINRFCTLGKHVLINVGAIISHDVVVGDFSKLVPAVRWADSSRSVKVPFLESGRPFATTSRSATALLCAGAVVVENVENSQTVMGVPAKPHEGGPKSW